MAIYDDDDDDSQAPYGADAEWDDDDRNGPQARDLVPDDRTTAPCTSCRKLIFDDSPRCPYCGDYQIEKYKKPRRYVAAVVLALCLMLVLIMVLWRVHTP